MLQNFSKVTLFNRPTPLEELKNLTKFLRVENKNCPRIFVKRDELTSLAMGGNKARSLEFILGEAVFLGCNQIIITGAFQSNYCRAAAAACAKLGLSCHVQLENRVPNMGVTYEQNGNVLLYKLLGAKISYFQTGDDEEAADFELTKIAESYKKRGKKPYIIKLAPDNKPIGSLGYVEAAKEILEQCKSMQLELSGIVTASGSASTHSGLIVGLALERVNIPVFGICVRRNAFEQRKRVSQVTELIFQLLEINDKIKFQDIHVNDSWLGDGYGTMSQDVLEAIRLCARTDAILTDPTYSGKSMAGLISMIRNGKFSSEENILFLHTGGHPNIFAYQEALAD